MRQYASKRRQAVTLSLPLKAPPEQAVFWSRLAQMRVARSALRPLALCDPYHRRALLGPAPHNPRAASGRRAVPHVRLAAALRAIPRRVSSTGACLCRRAVRPAVYVSPLGDGYCPDGGGSARPAARDTRYYTASRRDTA